MAPIDIVRESVAPEVPRTLARTARVLLAAWLTYAGLLLAPFKFSAPSGGLDGSWAFALNYFWDQGLVFGKDVAFTYGPLGFVANPMDIGTNLAIANGIRGCVWGLLLTVLWIIGANSWNGLWRAIVLSLTLVMMSRSLLYHFDYYVFALMFAIVAARDMGRWKYAAPAALAVCGAFLMLFKWSAYPGAELIVALYIIARLPEWRAARDPFELGLAGLALASGPIGYLAYHFSFADLGTYIRSGLELSAEYSEALAFAGKKRYSILAFLLMVFASAQLTWSVWRRTLSPVVAGFLAVLGFIAFKHGFVRADPHVVVFFAMIPLISAVALCLAAERPGAVRRDAAFWLACLGCGFNGLASAEPAWRASTWSVADNMNRWGELLDWPRTSAALREQAGKASSWNLLPPVLQARVAGTTTAVFPWEMSYASTGQFKLSPLFGFQGYCFSPYLDEKTSAGLASGTRRPDYVLVDWGAIDGRHPLLDSPRTAATLEGAYEPVELSGGHLLLKPRSRPERLNLVERGTTPVVFGQWIDAPDSSLPVWASARLPRSFAGWAKTTLLRADTLTLELELSGGVRIQHAVVSGRLQAPFALTGFSPNLPAYYRLLHDRAAEFPVRRLRFMSRTGGEDFGDSTITFWEQRNGSLRIGRPGAGEVP